MNIRRCPRLASLRSVLALALASAASCRTAETYESPADEVVFAPAPPRAEARPAPSREERDALALSDAIASRDSGVVLDLARRRFTAEPELLLDRDAPFVARLSDAVVALGLEADLARVRAEVLRDLFPARLSAWIQHAREASALAEALAARFGADRPVLATSTEARVASVLLDAAVALGAADVSAALVERVATEVAAAEQALVERGDEDVVRLIGAGTKLAAPGTPQAEAFASFWRAFAAHLEALRARLAEIGLPDPALTTRRAELLAELASLRTTLQLDPSCYETRRESCDPCGGDGELACRTCAGAGTCPAHCVAGTVVCSSCVGQGSSRCEACGGSGRLSCRTCGGDGHCHTCQGKGRVHCGRCQDGRCVAGCTNGRIPCNLCGGAGQVRCGHCPAPGKGRVRVLCRHCNDSGREVCGQCHGGRSIPCGTCHGTGLCGTCGGSEWLRCGTCNGSGACTGGCQAGSFDCNVCHGLRQVTCSPCARSGRVACPTCRGAARCPSCAGSRGFRCDACEGRGYTERRALSERGSLIQAQIADLEASFGDVERRIWLAERERQALSEDISRRAELLALGAVLPLEPRADSAPGVPATPLAG